MRPVLAVLSLFYAGYWALNGYIAATSTLSVPVQIFACVVSAIMMLKAAEEFRS